MARDHRRAAGAAATRAGGPGQGVQRADRSLGGRASVGPARAGRRPGNQRANAAAQGGSRREPRLCAEDAQAVPDGRAGKRSHKKRSPSTQAAGRARQRSRRHVRPPATQCRWRPLEPGSGGWRPLAAAGGPARGVSKNEGGGRSVAQKGGRAPNGTTRPGPGGGSLPIAARPLPMQWGNLRPVAMPPTRPALPAGCRVGQPRRTTGRTRPSPAPARARRSTGQRRARGEAHSVGVVREAAARRRPPPPRLQNAPCPPVPPPLGRRSTPGLGLVREGSGSLERGRTTPRSTRAGPNCRAPGQ